MRQNSEHLRQGTCLLRDPQMPLEAEILRKTMQDFLVDALTESIETIDFCTEECHETTKKDDTETRIKQSKVQLSKTLGVSGCCQNGRFRENSADQEIEMWWSDQGLDIATSKVPKRPFCLE